MPRLAKHEFFGLLDCNPAPVKVRTMKGGDGWMYPFSVDIVVLLEAPATHRVVNHKPCGTRYEKCLRLSTCQGGRGIEYERNKAAQARAQRDLAKYTRWLEEWRESC